MYSETDSLYISSFICFDFKMYNWSYYNLATRKATLFGNIGSFDCVKEEYFFTGNDIRGERRSYYIGWGERASYYNGWGERTSFMLTTIDPESYKTLKNVTATAKPERNQTESWLIN